MKTKWNTQTVVTAGMLAALAGVLMSFEFSLPFMPPFYKIDFSDIPSIIALFLLGPAPAACVEVIKILIKLVTVGTNTMYVGELSNLIGIFLFILPLWLLYTRLGRSRRAAAVSLAASVGIRTAFACFCNVFITLPLYAAAMGVSLDGIVSMVTAVNPAVQDLNSFVILATIPFNVLKLGLNYAAGYFLFVQLKAAVPFFKAA